MHDQFSGYYRPTEAEFDQLWAEGWFVLDANVLLNLYRYQQNARDEFLAALAKLAPRLWVPHQAVLEYQRNRVRVIREQLRKFRVIKKLINFDALDRSLRQYNNELRSLIDPTTFLKAVEPAFQQFARHIAAVEGQQIVVETDASEDPVRTFLDDLLRDRIGCPFSQADLNELYEDGRKRYAISTPPGYADLVKKGASEFQYAGMIYRTEFGDWLLWKQIMNWARENFIKKLVLVTDDRSEDWWQIVRDDGEPAKTIGPRPELAAELRSESGVPLFYMYQSERFLAHAKVALSIAVSSKSIDEVRDVSQRQALSEADIEFTDQIGTDFDHHAFQFLVRVNGDDQWCVIAQETVEDFFELSGNGGHAEAWQALRGNWHLIGAATRVAIRNGNVDGEGRVIVGMRELNSAARDASERRTTYDRAQASTHSVRFSGARENWPKARSALYATGHVGMIEMNHDDGVFEVTVTTRGRLNRASVYRALKGAGFEILPREPGA